MVLGKEEKFVNETREKHIYTVSEITRYLRAMIEDSFPGVWVEGEISNFILHSSGHMYFTLRDEKATLKCAMFSRANFKLKFRPKDGMKVILFGKMSVYEPRGDYQLIVEEIEPKGVGVLALKFQEMKEKLSKEGLFDESHKVPIPYLPTRIGVVTSPTGAAIQDILNVARRRFSNVEIIINPVRVQGEGAKDEISKAIRDFNSYKAIDVIIVARGGGSMEDLWPFNEEVVARAIYDSDIPVISAVGHEIDWTISDFVADLRAPTPSAAAELVIPKKEDLAHSVDTLANRLKNAIFIQIDRFTQQLVVLKDSYILRQPANIITQYEQRIDDLQKDLAIRVDHIVKMRQETFRTMAMKLEALSPLAILKRGYSITTTVSGGLVLKDVSIVKSGDRISTVLSKGKIISKIEEII